MAQSDIMILGRRENRFIPNLFQFYAYRQFIHTYTFRGNLNTRQQPKRSICVNDIHRIFLLFITSAINKVIY